MTKLEKVAISHNSILGVPMIYVLRKSKKTSHRNRIIKIIFKFRREGLERLTFCNKFYENPLIYKKVIEV